MHVAGSAWFPYFAFSDFSFQKHQVPHRSTNFLNVRLSLKDSTPKLLSSQIICLSSLPSLKTKAGKALQATVPSSVIAQSTISKSHEYMGNQVHDLNKFPELNTAQPGSKRTFLPHKRLKIRRGLSETSG